MERTLVHCLDIGRLVALGAGGDVKGNLLVFLECLETTALNRGEVREEIFATAVRCDKSKTLSIVKPLHGTCRHKHVPFSSEKYRGNPRSTFESQSPKKNKISINRP